MTEKKVKAHIVDDLCGDPNTGECRRLQDRTELGRGSRVGCSFLDSCNRGIGVCRSLSINVVLRLRLRLCISESVFECR
jgi:hypothetical protein